MSQPLPHVRARIELLEDATRRAVHFVRSRTDRPVAPDDATLAGLARLDDELPETGSDADAVLALLDEVGSPAAINTTGGRYFGFVTGGTEPVAAAASTLVTAWDQNAALPVMSPLAARIDEIAAGWVCRLLGLPASATAGFCAGASIANLTCLVAARDALYARAGWDVASEGLAGAPPLQVVTSAEIHLSVDKALRAIGIGRRAIEVVPTDDCGRIDLARLPALVPRSLVIAQAGNVNTGHSDPFAELVALVRERDGWLHVDGAFGLWAAASPDHRHLVVGVELADSWATDAHKWLNVPYDCGLAICARGDDLRQAMTVGAPYLPGAGPALAEPRDDPTDRAEGTGPGAGPAGGPDAGAEGTSEVERASMNLGLQMSQRARAIETWAVIATRGRTGIADLVATSCANAARLAELLVDGGAELLAPVVVNQALVAFGDDEATERVVAAVQAEGSCWVGPTTWQGRRAMRLSVSDSATTTEDIEAAAAAILACARVSTEPTI